VITELWITLWGNLLEWLFSGLPAYVAPDWVSGLAGAAGQVFGMAGSMGVWFPAPLVMGILVALLAVWLVSFTIKVMRLVLSLFTGGGGSAA
jgi:hypothetical protein